MVTDLYAGQLIHNYIMYIEIVYHYNENTRNYVPAKLTVVGQEFLHEIWKKTQSSPAMMYETPYPSSATGPNPPPADMCSGCLTRSNLFVC